MSELAKEYEEKVRETPLLERLEKAGQMIGDMCCNHRPPKMSIPVQPTDEDFFIGTTLQDAAIEIGELKSVQECYQSAYEAVPDYAAGDSLEECFRAMDRKVKELEAQIETSNSERAWIRQKLGLPEDSPFLSGECNTLAAAMHVVCAYAQGYERYVASHKCDDKEGQIARLTVALSEATEQANKAKELEAQLARSKDAAHTSADQLSFEVGDRLKAEDDARELASENFRLREALQTLTNNHREACIGVTYVEFQKRLLPERAQEILDLAWPA